MDYEKLKLLIENAVNDSNASNWWIYIAIIFFAGFCSMLGSYLRTKGQNFATKEDIEVITQKIEDVKSEYNKQLEFYKSSLQLNNQLKMAALDTRLQKHQEAYTLWRNLLFNLRNDDELYSSIDKCQKFWEENCLYLTDEVRKAYYTAFILAGDFHKLPKEDPSTIREWHKEITEAGKKIFEAFNIPAINEFEIEGSDKQTS